MIDLGVLLQGLLHFLVFVAYCFAILLVYRWLAPRLAPSARHLASFFLAAQILVILMSEATHTASGFTNWFWHVDREWNLAATLAAMQLALVGALSLATALIAAGRAAWQRLHLFLLGLVFLLFAYDEYFLLHESTPHLEDLYMAFGVLIILTTALAARSAPGQWQWYACIPVGLGLAALGAIGLETHSTECAAWGYVFHFGECIRVYGAEEAFEFLGIWLALIGALGLFSNASSLSKRRYRRALWALPALLLVLLLSSGAVVPISQQTHAVGWVELEGGIDLHGYLLERSKPRLRIHLFLSPNGWDFEGLGYSITLLDQDSLSSVAKSEAYTHYRLDFLIAPGFQPVFRQWMELDIPPDAPRNRAMWIVLSFWREEDGDFVRQKILSSDLQRLSDTQLILDEFVLKASTALPENHTALASFENGFMLEDVDLPDSVQAGDTMPFAVSWRSQQNSDDDYIQFLHLGHEESGRWFAHDQFPLGDRLPTRLWYNGLSDSERWLVPLPADLPAGSYSVFTGLYAARGGERLMARDANGEPYLDSRVPLGRLLIQA